MSSRNNKRRYPQHLNNGAVDEYSSSEANARKHPAKKEQIPADLRAIGIDTLEKLREFRAD